MYELALAHTSQELRTAYIFTLLRRKFYARTSYGVRLNSFACDF